MVSILAYVVEVLFFLELSSALSHNDVLGVSNKTDAETITDSFLKIPEQLLPDENFADADANRRYAEVSLPDAISEENHDKTRESGESDGKDAGDKHDDGKIDNKEKIADSTTADDHSKASDQKVSIISSNCIGPSFPYQRHLFLMPPVVSTSRDRAQTKHVLKIIPSIRSDYPTFVRFILF